MMPLHYMRSCGLKRCKGAAPITISARASWREAHAALRAQMSSAAIAQLGERQTEDLKVPGSIPGLGIIPDETGCRSEQKLITHEMTSCNREGEMEDCGVGV